MLACIVFCSTVVGFVGIAGAKTATSPATTPAYKNWPLAWSDEFTSATLNTNMWEYGIGNACDYGFCGWGNNEQESYQKDAVYIQDGALAYTASVPMIGNVCFIRYASSDNSRMKDLQLGRICPVLALTEHASK